MPLLRRNTARGRGGTRDQQDFSENRRSIADLLGLDTSGLAQSVVEPAQLPNDLGGEASWQWSDSGRSETAQTPRVVPSCSIPQRRSMGFNNHSEGAQLGTSWSEGFDSGQMNTLLASLDSMRLSSQSTSSLHDSLPQPASNNHFQLDRVSEHHPSPPEQAGTSTADDRSDFLSRRASFGGLTAASRSDEPNLAWDGVLPQRCSDPAGGFSAKVFLGGLPWDIGEQALMHTLKAFNPVRVEWPGRETGGVSPRGYAYVTFENERCVRALLAASRFDGRDWYYRITSRKMRNKEVQVIPWAVSDSNWVGGGSTRLEPSRTVFVGALHGMISAAGLAVIMNDLFPGVVYAGIDTDRNKYPIGSGRVTFNNVRSYVRAISAAFIQIRTSKFTKKVQIDPYLEDSMCSVCKLRQGPYFCREPSCFGYFCRSCWTWSHVTMDHKPLMRSSKSAQYLNSPMPVAYAATPSGSAMLAVPQSAKATAVPKAVPIHTHEDGRSGVFNGRYSNRNEGTPSSCSASAASGASSNSGTSFLLEPEPEPGLGSEAEPGWLI